MGRFETEWLTSERAAGFGPTRRSIARIAREGRKYGVSLCLVSQRPSELDPAILSPCNTLFALRMNNERARPPVRPLRPARCAGHEVGPQRGERQRHRDEAEREQEKEAHHRVGDLIGNRFAVVVRDEFPVNRRPPAAVPFPRRSSFASGRHAVINRGELVSAVA